MGRRSHIPDPTSRRQVEAMSAYGIPEADVAQVIGIDPKTLRKHYRRELDTGGIRANSKVAEHLYRKATTDGHQSVTAAIFWLKTRAGWKETQVNEVTVEAGDSIKLLMQRIALSGKRVQDHEPEIGTDYRSGWSSSEAEPALPAAPTPRLRVLTGGT